MPQLLMANDSADLRPMPLGPLPSLDARCGHFPIRAHSSKLAAGKLGDVSGLPFSDDQVNIDRMQTVPFLTPHTLRAYLCGGPVPAPLVRLCDGLDSARDYEAFSAALPLPILDRASQWRVLSVASVLKGRRFPLAKLLELEGPEMAKKKNGEAKEPSLIDQICEGVDPSKATDAAKKKAMSEYQKSRKAYDQVKAECDEKMKAVRDDIHEKTVALLKLRGKGRFAHEGRNYTPMSNGDRCYLRVEGEPATL